MSENFKLKNILNYHTVVNELDLPFLGQIIL